VVFVNVVVVVVVGGALTFVIDFVGRVIYCDRQFVLLLHGVVDRCILIDVFRGRRRSKMYKGRFLA